MAKDFNFEPYWDDFQATNGALEKNYMRILFRPGYAVQGRELTQLQSILQNQIKQFGSHIFADGSPVMGGHLSIDTDVSYLKLNPQYNNVDVDLESFLGLVVFNTAYPQSRAKVIQTYSSGTERVLLVKYLKGPGFLNTETLTTVNQTTATLIQDVALSFTGMGSTISINQGVFYVDGFFVTVGAQTIVLDPYSSTPTYRVGLQIDETIVTESEDTALLDPAQESFNYQAPGAHRYQYNLVLTKRALTSSDDSKFFELLRVENGVITKQVSYPVYSELEKTLARRTYDESGDYTVRPFIADTSANTSNSNQIIINVSPGKAYVKGMEFETIGTTKIPVPRALTTKSNKGYSLSTYYGNRLLVSNLFSGVSRTLASEGMTVIDIHGVANTGVNLTGNVSAYHATRIGTGKIKNIERYGDANTYYLYLTDLNFAPIVGFANGTSANTSSINLGSTFSSTAGAYVNAKITLVNTVGGVGNASFVTSYDATNKIAVVSPPFAVTPKIGDSYSISMGIKDTQSLIVPNTMYSFIGANLQMNVSPQSRDGSGNVVLEDSNYDKGVFALPNFYVAGGNTEASVGFYRKSIFTNQGFTVSGIHANVTITLPSGHTADFGSDGQLVDSASIKENIILVSQTGEIIDLSVTPKSVYRTGSQSLTIDANSLSAVSGSLTGDIYITSKVSNAQTAPTNLIRRKVLIQANATLSAVDSLAAATLIDTVGSVAINSSNGVVWFTNANSIITSTFDRQSLYVADVVRIKGIYQSGNLNYAPNLTNYTDITGRYLLDSGQNDVYYDHASIRLKPDAQPPVGQTAVFFDYYNHVGQGFISASSYPVNDYNTEAIPAYRSEVGVVSYLRDAIDLRPVRSIGTTVGVDPWTKTSMNATATIVAGNSYLQATGNTIVPPLSIGSMIKINGETRTVNAVINVSTVTVSTPFSAAATGAIIYAVTPNKVFSGSLITKPTRSFTLDYDFYLPRIDKIVITKDKEFKLLYGIPDTVPREPADDPTTAMTVYKVYLPAFTASLRNVNLEFIENRRYTMKDIAALDTRINAIEEYIQVKESETRIIGNPPKSALNPTVNKPVYGTLVDEFSDLTVVDMTNDFAASIENGMMSCYKNVVPVGLQIDDASGAHLGDKLVTLPYTETSVISQGLATAEGWVPVVPDSLIAKFNGYATLVPETDYYYSTEHIPSFSDILGMFYSVPQTTKTTSASLTTAVVNAMGGGQYSTLTSNSAATTLTGTAVNITSQYGITIPATSSNTAQTEPTVTNQINMNFVGVMPVTSLNNNWTGGGPVSSSVDPNLYGPYGSSSLSAGDLYNALAAYYGTL